MSGGDDGWRDEELRLRPLPRILSRFEGPVVGMLRYGVALDVETTGRDHLRDQIIELCAQKFRYDEEGRIHDVYPAQNWLEQPSGPLTEEIVKLTGLTDAVLRKKSIHDGPAYSMLYSNDIIIAHNAQFDRPFVDARLGMSGQAWGCSMADVEWREYGFEGRALSHLLMQAGWRYRAHRAESDVNALMHLLAHELGEGRTVLSELLRNSARAVWRLDAYGARFEAAPKFRDRGWQWSAARRCWSIELGAPVDRDLEIEWAVFVGYNHRGRPAVSLVTARERYTA